MKNCPCRSETGTTLRNIAYYFKNMFEEKYFSPLSMNSHSGFDDDMYNDIIDGGPPSQTSPPTSLLPSVRYEKLMSLFNGKEQNGHFCRTKDDIRNAMENALKETQSPSLINVMINPMAQRKAQAFEWLTRSKV